MNYIARAKDYARRHGLNEDNACIVLGTCTIRYSVVPYPERAIFEGYDRPRTNPQPPTPERYCVFDHKMREIASGPMTAAQAEEAVTHAFEAAQAVGDETFDVVLCTRQGADRWQPVGLGTRDVADFERDGGVFGNLSGARHMISETQRIYAGCDEHIINVHLRRLNGTDRHECSQNRPAETLTHA